jgi:hypothetical protein
MEYLPKNIAKARVLITVKTYPQPSHSYGELVCTAGILSDGKWIRIYPIPFRRLQSKNQFKKYQFIELDLTRRERDFRPESYKPLTEADENIKIVGELGTANNWSDRKNYVLREVFHSMKELISQAKGTNRKSLATVYPKEIIDFVIEQDTRDWDPQKKEELHQLQMFEQPDDPNKKQLVRKMPYKYFYRFITEDDTKPRKVMIEDWEIGALYWNCLKATGGDENEANQLVKKKYFDEFVNNKNLYFLMGTTLSNHIRAPNPFVIIGLFYPPKSKTGEEQLSLDLDL